MDQTLHPSYSRNIGYLKRAASEVDPHRKGWFRLEINQRFWS